MSVLYIPHIHGRYYVVLVTGSDPSDILTIQYYSCIPSLKIADSVVTSLVVFIVCLHYFINRVFGTFDSWRRFYPFSTFIALPYICFFFSLSPH